MHSLLQTRDAQLTMYVVGSRKSRESGVCFTINRDIVVEIGKWHEGQGLNLIPRVFTRHDSHKYANIYISKIRLEQEEIVTRGYFIFSYLNFIKKLKE